LATIPFFNTPKKRKTAIMINGFSKFAVLYLSPLLMLTALFLSLFAYLAPSVILHDRVALLTVMPSTALTNPQARAGDGPSLFLGVLGSFNVLHYDLNFETLMDFTGSCSRHNNAGDVSCTITSISPEYGTLASRIFCLRRFISH
jgi:hypothetical protein